MNAPDRAAALRVYADETAGCTRCPLAATRTQVVFGVGNPDADLLFVGEAPGFHEDQNGIPFVGQAGKLLDRLLGGIGLERSDIYIANVLKCLRYNALVQLGDGSWERIGRLVRQRYSGSVMAVDEAGCLVPRRVTGWHETPLAGRRVYRLTYASAKNAGSARVGIQLTGDHPVLTERGYVPVQELRGDDRIATGQGMSDLAFDVVCGTLLGDASICKAASSLTFGHSARQAEYAVFKAELLAELRPKLQSLTVAAVVGGERAYDVVHVRTRADRALRTLRSDFYGDDGKHVPAWLENRLSDRMLAVWFMDDGHMRIRPGRQPLAEIETVSFDDSDLQVLIMGLGRLGLAAKALRGRLYFDVSATRALSERIAPYVPSSMRYKLHPDVEASVPFDAARSQPRGREVLYDFADVEDITDRDRTDTTFFCIDVEETHNFVTSGGVVHNCRPPQNRDPQPDEIASCEPHLFRQIELIQPKLVATLGNFATKLLSGKPVGITRVHGQQQQVSLGGNSVLLYPLYHPAAALYTPSMLKVLEEDFARIPALIERSAAAVPVAVRHDPEAVPVAAPASPAATPEAVQLGLF